MASSAIIVFAWLIVAAIQDLRRHEVSRWLTLLPLAVGTGWRAWNGDWIALILFGLTLAVDRLPALAAASAFGAVALAGRAVGWVSPAASVVSIVWTTCYAAWRFNVIAGADAHICIALVALFPDTRLAWLCLVASLAVSLIVLAARGAAASARSLATTALRLWALNLPTRAELEAKGAPLVVAFPIAFAAWWMLGLLHI